MVLPLFSFPCSSLELFTLFVNCYLHEGPSGGTMHTIVLLFLTIRLTSDMTTDFNKVRILQSTTIFDFILFILKASSCCCLFFSVFSLFAPGLVFVFVYIFV